MPELRIGTSGYQYDHWRGVFYPEDLPKENWFHYYAARFDTVEINNTFYRLPQSRVFTAWRRQASKSFSYALKLSRYGTHLKRLKDPQKWIRNFTDPAAKLRQTLGAILVQLPPRWDIDVERLRGFFNVAPRRYRWAVEFRDPRWLCAETYDVLRKHNAALCIHDMLPEHPREITADWVYLRFHGVKYGGSYARASLKKEAKRIKTYLDQGLDVFAYFNNDREGHAVRNALELKNYLKVKSGR